MLAIPLGGNYPVGDGLAYGLTLTYNAKVWDQSVRLAGSKGNPQTYRRFEPGAGFNAGLGWTVGLGELVAKSSFYAYRGPDGSEHPFYSTLHLGEPAVTGFFYTRDGTYLRLQAIGTIGLTYEVEFPDGTIHRFQRGGSTQPFRLIRISDRFGNHANVNQGTTLWTLSDGSRTQRVHFAAVGGEWVVDRVELTAFGGSVDYDFVYEVKTIPEPCADTDPQTGKVDPVTGLPTGTRDVVLLTAVHLPADAGAYLIDPETDYHQTCTDLGREMVELPGVLRRVRLPTRGSVEWTYQLYSFPERAPGPPGEPSIDFSDTVGVATRTILNAAGQCETWNGVGCTWTYSPEMVNPLVTRRTRVTLPTGHTEVHYFYQRATVTTAGWEGWQYGLPIHVGASSGSGYFLSREIFDGPATGTPKRSVYVGFERDELTAPNPKPADWYNSNRRLQRIKTIYHDDTGKHASVVLSSFDGLGHYRRRVTGGNFGDADVRTDHTDYNPGQHDYSVDPATNQPSGGYVPWLTTDPWVLGSATASWAQEGASRIETRLCFEKATGFLAWRRTLKNGTSPQSTDTLVVYSRDPSDRSIEEAHYGGDPGGLPATPPSASCALTGLPAAQYRLEYQFQHGALARSSYLKASGVEELRVLDLQIDAPSALPARSTDPAGLVTDLEYDGFGRLTWIKPQTGHDAWIEHLHRKATGGGMLQLARTEVRARANGSKSGAVRAERWLHYDGFGRLAWDRAKLPGAGWTKVRAVYNSMGWPFAVSERHADGDPNNQLFETRFFNYDPFGRPGIVRPADGSAHDMTFSYAGVRAVTRTVKIGTGWNGTSVTETSAATTEVYDRQGRLVRVREPEGLAHDPYQAVYGYDAAHRLRNVNIQPQPGGSGPSQPRSFTYDGRGFLTAESHPETAIVYSDHDALGHPRRMRQGAVNGPFDLALVYDRAGRLTLVEEAGTGADLKSFIYATANAAGNLKKGKLETAIRHNWVINPATGNLVDIVVTEQYTYGAVGGRASRRDTSISTGHAFTQSWAFDDLGRVASLTYPTCTFSECLPANPMASTVAFGYTDGLLTSVPGYAGAITYHSNGTLNQVQHANGVTYSRGLDPHRMPRPASIAVSGGSVGATLAYGYDGGGNITMIGTEVYLYDKVGRVTEARLGSGTQTYRFDPFGNITQIQTTPAGGSTTTQSLGVDTATNRLSAASYDTAGNQLTWGSFGYTFDSLSKLEHVGGGGQALTNVYTAGDERIWSVDATTFPWKETLTLRDLDGKVLRTFRTDNGFGGPWQWVEDYVYRDGALLASRRPGEGTRYFHSDHLGTPRMITNSTGQNVGGFSLYAFGAAVTATNASAERMRFTSHERELGTSFSSHGDDLDSMHARFYNPLIGRFLSVDPIGGDLGLVQSWNRYAYALGNPLKYVDPSGLDEGDLEYSFYEWIDVNDMVIEVTPKATPWVPFSPWRAWPSGGGGGTGGVGSGRGASRGVPFGQGQEGVEPECDMFDKIDGTIERGFNMLGAVVVSGDLPLYLISGVLNLGAAGNITANADGSATFYLGGGFILGGGTRVSSPRLGGSFLQHSTGSASGWGVRAAGGIPLGLAGLGLRASGFLGDGRPASAGLGLVSSPSGSLTVGYAGTIREATVTEPNPCAFF